MPRLRFSLRSLFFLSLLVGCCMLAQTVWKRGPWTPRAVINEPGRFPEWGFSPDDAMVYTIVEDPDSSGAAPGRTLMLLDSETGRLLRRQKLIPGAFFRFSPTGAYFSVSRTSSRMGRLDCDNGAVFRTDTGDAIWLNDIPDNLIYSLYFSPTEKWVLVSTEKSTYLATFPELKVVKHLSNVKYVKDYCFSENDGFFAFVETERFHVVSLTSGEEKKWDSKGARFSHVSLSPDGSMLALCDENYPGRLIQIIDWKKSTPIDEFTGSFINIEKGYIDPVSEPFTADGKRFVYTSTNYGKVIRTLESKVDEPYRSATAPRMFNATIGSNTYDPTAQPIPSPDGEFAFVQGRDLPSIIDVSTGAPLLEFSSTYWQPVLASKRFIGHFGHRDAHFMTCTPPNLDVTTTRFVTWKPKSSLQFWRSRYGRFALPETWLACVCGIVFVWSLWRDWIFFRRARKPAA